MGKKGTFCYNYIIADDDTKSLIHKGEEIVTGITDKNNGKVIDDLESEAKDLGISIEKYLDELVLLKGAKQIFSKGKIIAKFTKGVKLELLGRQFKNLYGGTNILLKGDSTIAITGLLSDVLDIKRLGFKVDGLWGQGLNVGGLDMLSSPVFSQLKKQFANLEKTNPKLFWKNVTDGFWNKVNKPWLDDIIKRGDDVRFVTNPSSEKSKYVYITKEQKFATDSDGNKILTIFAREVEYLLKNGYKIEGSMAVKIKKQ